MSTKSSSLMKLLLVAAISFLASISFVTAVEIAYRISAHPLTSLMMRLVLFGLLLIPLILRNKEIVIFYFLLSMPFMRIAFSGISLLTIYAVLLMILYRKEVSNFIRQKQNIFAKPFMLIFFIMTYTTLLAHHRMDAVRWVVFFLSLAAVYYVLASYMNSDEKIKKVLFALMPVIVFAVMISLGQLLFGINSIKFFFGEYNPNTNIYGIASRIPSFFSDAQEAGLFYATASFLILGLISMIKKGRIFLYMILIGVLFCLLLTITRIAVLGLLAGWAVVSLRNFSFCRSVILGLLLTFGLFTGGLIYQKTLPGPIKERLSKHSREKGFDFRYKLWRESLPIAATNLLGVGLGGQNLYAAGLKNNVYFPPVLRENLAARQYTHFENSYLDLLYSLGFAGVGAFLFLLTQYFIAARGVTSRSHRGNLFSFYLTGGMVAWLFCASTSPQFSNAQAMIIFVLLLAFVSARQNPPEKTKRQIGNLSQKRPR